MLEVGTLNRQLAQALASLGHGDTFIVTDAGFAIPAHVPTIDLSISENLPTVMQLLTEIKRVFSVEALTLAKETQEHCPSHSAGICELFGLQAEVISHIELKERAKGVKYAIRTADFTAWGNVILTSGSGDRWAVERS